jgi:hypothetical protein
MTIVIGEKTGSPVVAALDDMYRYVWRVGRTLRGIRVSDIAMVVVN